MDECVVYTLVETVAALQQRIDDLENAVPPVTPPPQVQNVALRQRVDVLEAENTNLRVQMNALQQRIDDLEHAVPPETPPPQVQNVALRQRVDVLEADNTLLKEAVATIPFPMNMIDNGAMTELDPAGHPRGYRTFIYPNGPQHGSHMELKAMHPFTKGFHGPYTTPTDFDAQYGAACGAASHGAASNAAAGGMAVAGATEATPIYCGRYRTGMGRGALRGGWCGLDNGHILKITGRHTGVFWEAGAGSPHRQAHMVSLPCSLPACFTSAVRFRAYVRIEHGTCVKFRHQDLADGHVVTKATADASPRGWHFVDVCVSGQSVSLVSHKWVFPIEIQAAAGVDYEVYLALPHISPVTRPHDPAAGHFPCWTPSCRDAATAGRSAILSLGADGTATNASPLANRKVVWNRRLPGMAPYDDASSGYYVVEDNNTDIKILRTGIYKIDVTLLPRGSSADQCLPMLLTSDGTILKAGYGTCVAGKYQNVSIEFTGQIRAGQKLWVIFQNSGNRELYQSAITKGEVYHSLVVRAIF